MNLSERNLDKLDKKCVYTKYKTGEEHTRSKSNS